MTYALSLLIALLFSAAAELGLRTGWVAPLLWLPALAIPALAVRATRRLQRTGRQRTAAQIDRLISPLPWLGQAVAVCVLGYGEWLSGHGVDVGALVDWPGFGVILLLLPYFALELLVIEARCREFPLRMASSLRKFQQRQLMSSAGVFLLILLFTLPIREFRTVRVILEEVAAAEAIWIAGLLGSLLVLLPGFVRMSWNTTPMPPGDSRAVLDGLARRAEFRYRELLLWRTGNLVANAAIVGFGPRGRMILFSDALLNRLAPRELAAVFGHEMGHSLRRHLFAFLSWTLGLVLVADWLSTEVEAQLEQPELWLGGMLLGLPVTWYLTLGWASRRFELDADLVSVELTGDPEALAAALEKVSGKSGRERDSWRHFSTAKRVRFLQAWAKDPKIGDRLRRRLGIFVAASAALFAFGLAMKVHSIIQVFPEDRVLAELRLGHYAAAGRHAAQADLDPELAELARLGDELLQLGSTDPAAWPDLARAARAQGQELRAERIGELGALRGFPQP